MNIYTTLENRIAKSLFTAAGLVRLDEVAIRHFDTPLLADDAWCFDEGEPEAFGLTNAAPCRQQRAHAVVWELEAGCLGGICRIDEVDQLSIFRIPGNHLLSGLDVHGAKPFEVSQRHDRGHWFASLHDNGPLALLCRVNEDRERQHIRRTIAIMEQIYGWIVRD